MTRVLGVGVELRGTSFIKNDTSVFNDRLIVHESALINHFLLHTHTYAHTTSPIEAAKMCRKGR